MGFSGSGEINYTGNLGKRTLPQIDSDLDWLLGQVQVILGRVTNIEQRLIRLESNRGDGSGFSGTWTGGYPW